MAEASAAPTTGTASCRMPSTWLTWHPRLPNRTRMQRSKSSALTGTAELDAMAEQVAPSILELLGDGVPRTVAAVAQALADRHEREDMIVTLLRLAVTGQVEDTGGKYTLAAAEAG